VAKSIYVSRKSIVILLAHNTRLVLHQTMATIFDLTILSCPQHCTTRKLSLLANYSNEGEQGTSITSEVEREEQCFQETYKERTRINYSMSRGHR
jgi:hypothetical protein